LLLDPNCFASTFFIPANSRTVLVEPPAITPEPVADGLNRILAAPDIPFIGCGIDKCLVSGILIICFLASATPFLTAPITSFAFPTPTPI